MSSLQIKRNSIIFDNKDLAVEHLSGMDLIDGEISLCRYWANEKIETLIGAAYVDENDIKHISYVNSLTEVVPEGETVQIQVGDGLVQEEDGTVNVKVKDDGYLKINDNGELTVEEMGADVTTLKEPITVAGLSGTFGSGYYKDGQTIEAGTDIYTILQNILCQDSFPTGYKATNCSVKSSIKEPLVTLSLKDVNIENNQLVEVGSKINIKSIKFNGDTEITKTSASITGLTKGYSLQNDNTVHSTNTSIIKIPDATVNTGETKTIHYDWFNGDATGLTQSGETTGTTDIEISNVELGSVTYGQNKIIVSITGQSVTYSCEGIGKVYPCSILGKTDVNKHVGPVNEVTATTISAPTTSKTFYCIGCYKYYIGLLNNHMLILQPLLMHYFLNH